MSPSTTHRRAFRGSEIVWTSTGTGAPLLFLRGFDIGFNTDDFVARLAETNTVLTPDHPGCGASDVPSWLRGMSDLAFFYLDFLDSLELTGVHLVGASLGGWLAAEIGIRDRSRISRLSLVSPAGLRYQQQDFGDPFIRAPDALNELLFAQSYLSSLRGREVDADDAAIDLRLKNSFGLARIGWQPRLASAELQRWAHRLAMPVHVIWGGADRVIPPAHAGAWTSTLPQATLTLIEGAGHLAHVERPAAVADAILSPAGGAAQ